MSETFWNRTSSGAFNPGSLIHAGSPLSYHFGFTALILIAYFIVAKLTASDSWISQAFFAEDHLGEWAQVLCCLCIAVVAFRTFRLTDNRYLSSALFLGGLGILFIGGEEVSWGQRLFNFHSDYFMSRNYQGETNLHNMLPLESNLLPYYLAAFVIGVVLNAVGFKLTPRGMKWPVADMFFSALVMSSFYIFLPMSQNIYFYEYSELWIYSSILIFLVRIRKNILEEMNRGVL